MSVVRLENLHWSATSADIRFFFRGLEIPEGGVHIIGGSKEEAFISFSRDEDAFLALEKNGLRLKTKYVTLTPSSVWELEQVREKLRMKDSSEDYPDDDAEWIAPASASEDTPYSDVDWSSTMEQPRHRSRHSTKVSRYSPPKRDVASPEIHQRKRSRSSSHRAYSPTHRTYSPTHRTYSPMHRTYSPTHRSHSPSRRSPSVRHKSEKSQRRNQHVEDKEWYPDYPEESDLISMIEFPENRLSPEREIEPKEMYDRHSPEGVQHLPSHYEFSPVEDSSIFMEHPESTRFVDDSNWNHPSSKEHLEYQDSITHFPEQLDFSHKSSEFFPRHGMFGKQDIPLESQQFADIYPPNLSTSDHSNSIQSHQRDTEYLDIFPNYCIQISGLSTVSTFKDVKNLLKGNYAPQCNIKWDVNSQGCKTGIVYVRMSNKEDFEEILLFKDFEFNGRPVSITKCPDAIFYDLFRHSKPQGNKNPRKTQGKRKRTDFCYMLKGLPYACSEFDVLNFFTGVDMSDLLILYDNNGKATGTGYAQFLCKEDYQEAFKRNGKKIGHRYIELFECSLEEINDAKTTAVATSKPMHDLLNEQMFRNRNLLFKQNLPQKRPLCIVLSGLPPTINTSEVFAFFNECDVRPNAVHNVLNENHHPSGRAFIEFLDLFDLDVALKQQGKLIGSNMISVKQVLFDEMLKILELNIVQHDFGVIQKQEKQSTVDNNIPEKLPYIWEPLEDVQQKPSCDNHSVQQDQTRNLKDMNYVLESDNKTKKKTLFPGEEYYSSNSGSSRGESTSFFKNPTKFISGHQDELGKQGFNEQILDAYPHKKNFGFDVRKLHNESTASPKYSDYEKHQRGHPKKLTEEQYGKPEPNSNWRLNGSSDNFYNTKRNGGQKSHQVKENTSGFMKSFKGHRDAENPNGTNMNRSRSPIKFGVKRHQFVSTSEKVKETLDSSDGKEVKRQLKKLSPEHGKNILSQKASSDSDNRFVKNKGTLNRDTSRTTCRDKSIGNSYKGNKGKPTKKTQRNYDNKYNYSSSHSGDVSKARSMATGYYDYEHEVGNNQPFASSRQFKHGDYDYQDDSYSGESVSNSCIVHVSNVPLHCRANDMFDFFRGFCIRSEDIIRRYTDSGAPTSDVRITFRSPRDAKNVVTLLNGCKLQGNIISLAFV